MILKLFEASLSATVRMRLAPLNVQITLDRLSFTEEIRLMNITNSGESFFEFVTTCATLPGVEASASPAMIATNLNGLGVSFKGKKIEKQLQYAISAALPFVLDENAKRAIRFVERVAPKLFTDPTKCMRCCQTLKKIVSPFESWEALIYLWYGKHWRLNSLWRRE